jgi:hypothetical protein
VLVAAATKPIYGLFAITIFVGICRDASKYLGRADRNRFVLTAFGLFSLFALAYALNYSHLGVRSMPYYPVLELSERLSRAVELLTSNFSIPFRAMLGIGLVISPFLRRIRWVAFPLFVGFWLWANTASYDLRNALGLLLISGFIPLFAVARSFLAERVPPSGPRWRMPDSAVASAISAVAVCLTLTLAKADADLKQRFATDQLRGGMGFEINQRVAELLRHGCTIFSADAYVFTISALRPLRDQLKFFVFSLPLDQSLASRINNTAGCTGIVYPTTLTHPSILDFLTSYAEGRGLSKIVDDNGMVILATSP